jgi:superfamily II DNA or RNA helicase
MEINDRKTARQDIGINNWLKAGGKGTFYWVTAMGKTHAGTRVINRAKIKFPDIKTTIIVPNVETAKQWEDHIIRLISEDIRINIDIYTIGQLLTEPIQFTTGLLIVDELHEYYAPERSSVIDRIKAQYVLCLTATPYDRHNRHHKLLGLYPIVDVISEEYALKEGFISKFIEFNIGVSLTQVEREIYDELTLDLNKHLSKFGKGGLDMASRCLSGGKDKADRYYNANSWANMWANRMGWTKGCAEDINELWNPHKIIGYAKSLFASIRARKNILYSADNKIPVVVELIKKYPVLKAICFSQSTVFADQLAKAINEVDPFSCVAYHSNLKTELQPIGKDGKLKKVGKTVLKRQAMEALADGRATRLSTASALDKALNIVDIRLVVISSGTSNFNQAIQRKGRGKRIEIFYPDAIVLIVNLYVKNSQEEKWLRVSQSKSTNKVFWINNVNEINYEPKHEDAFNLGEI